MAAHQAPLSLGFSRQEHWSGLPFPSPMHESKKWKWSRSVVSNSSRPHGLQPTRLLRPWDFPDKSTGVGCHWRHMCVCVYVCVCVYTYICVCVCIYIYLPQSSSVDKGSACNSGDLGSIPGSGRSPGEGNATHSSILAWKSHTGRGSWQVTVYRLAKESDTTEQPNIYI